MQPGFAESARVDLRLVPAALAAWAVSAAGICWPVGRAVACCCLALAAAGVVAHRAARRSAIGAGLVAVGVVGAGFGFAIALRADAVARHPITAVFGTAAPVTVTPSESPLSLAAEG